MGFTDVAADIDPTEMPADSGVHGFGEENSSEPRDSCPPPVRQEKDGRNRGCSEYEGWPVVATQGPIAALEVSKRAAAIC